DEPLTVAQTIPEARAVIVTTPQEVSLADVRKSINFCREVNMQILGIVENMSGQKCPQCGHEISLFKSGGGERTARDMGIPFLGKIPIDPAVVTAGDAGKPYVLNTDNGVAAKAFNELIDKIISMSK
ncbi:MAG: P-loop NTPase, partial [Deltaproteobacteria bacterium]|nr:P-loop NTPase [Deltaproteobacteria bacterium]